ncbi:hypothetical protein ACHHYP_06238 [Achlya hypogyna]|uniref:Secreted protein n=1 Tax=Achlya hypogyna TaxID=1202772 RepID=A0A1V9YUR3_ACHHY|nr:hypothetical protein ACHHYP_06238 [Achlya hypogyna]
MWLAAIATFIVCCCVQAVLTTERRWIRLLWRLPRAATKSCPPPLVVAPVVAGPCQRTLARELAAVLETADLVVKIAEFVTCPFALHALLQMVPIADLSLPFRAFVDLATSTPPSQLWPELLDVSAHAAPITAIVGAIRRQSVSDLRPSFVPLALSAPTTMSMAAAWHGVRVVECSLTIAATDTDVDVVRTAAWLASTPDLRRLTLQFTSHLYGRDGCRALVAALSASAVVDLTLVSGGDPRYSAAMASALLALLANKPMKRIALTGYTFPRRAQEVALAHALRCCRTLRALELHSMLGFTATFMEAPLPPTLRRLVLHSTSLLRDAAVTTQLVEAMRGANLTHFRVDRKHPLYPEHDASMAQLLRVLPTLSHLAHLALTFLSLGDDSAAALAAALPRLPQLEALQLRSVGWGGGRQRLVALLCDAAPKSHRLHRLALRGLCTAAAGPTAWTSCPSLQYVCVRGCDGPAAWPTVRVCCADGQSGACVFADSDACNAAP